MTKREIITEWKQKISKDPRWATRALLAIYEKQTESEKQSETTREYNGVGFTAFDGELLTSFAKQVQAGRELSPRQLSYLFKRMPKYAGQLYQIVNQ